MGSRGIFHRLSSVAVERPLPIPSPPALMYTTPAPRVSHDAASAGPGGPRPLPMREGARRGAFKGICCLVCEQEGERAL